MSAPIVKRWTRGVRGLILRALAYLASCALVYHLSDNNKPLLHLYIIVSLLAIVVASTRSSGGKKKKLGGGGKSAYPMLNPGGERLLGEVTSEAFGIRDATARTGASSSASATIAATTTAAEGRRALAKGTDAFRQSRRYRLQLANSRGLRMHHKCLCGSNVKFAQCCQALYVELRQKGWHVNPPPAALDEEEDEDDNDNDDVIEEYR